MPYKDPAKQLAAKATHYQEHKDIYRNRLRARRLDLAQWIAGIKRTLKCSSCPEDNPVCLDFHHRDRASKFMGVSVMVKAGYSKPRILAEIAKCDVVCSNCHRKLHAKATKAA